MERLEVKDQKKRQFEVTRDPYARYHHYQKTTRH